MEIKIPEDAKISNTQTSDDVPNIAALEAEFKTNKDKSGPGFIVPKDIAQGDIITGIDAVGEGLAESSGSLGLPPLMIGAAAAGFGLKGAAAGLRAAKSLKSSPFAKNVSDFATAAKQKVSSATDTIGTTAKETYNSVSDTLGAIFKKSPIDKTTQQTSKEKFGDIFRPNKTTQQTSKEKFDEFFKNEKPFNPKIGKPLGKIPTKKPIRNPFRVSGNVGGSILGGLAGLGASLFGGGNNNDQNRNSGNLSNLSALPNLSAALTSMPSGGDSGMVGESHFGGGSLNGLTIMEALSKIYSLLVESNDELRKISGNTSRMLKQSANADTASDIASANAGARANETGYGYSAITRSTDSEYLKPDIDAPENNTPEKENKSGLWSKLAGVVGRGVGWTAKAAGVGVGLGAVAASDAQANIGVDLLSRTSKLMSSLSGDNQYDRLKSIIKEGESRGNYSVVYGGGKPKKELTEMSIREVLEYQEKMLQTRDENGKAHSPVGAYQIIRDTLKENYELAGLSLDDKFTPENQDKIADVLIAKRMQRSDGSAEGFAKQLALEWASLGDPTQENGTRKPIPSSVVMAAIAGVEDDETAIETPSTNNLDHVLTPSVDNAKKFGFSNESSLKLPEGTSVLDNAIKPNQTVSKVLNNSDKTVALTNQENITEPGLQFGGKYSRNPNTVISQSELFKPQEMGVDPKTGELFVKSNTPSVTPIFDESTNYENLRESTLGASSIITEKPQDQSAMQSVNENLTKVAQLVASNQQQPAPQPMRASPPDAAGNAGSIMSVRNEDPVLLTLTYGNVKTA